MKRDILVALYSEDSYAINWMSLLVVRDWRTRVVVEASSAAELHVHLNQEHQYIDTMVLDLDLITNLRQVSKEINAYASYSRKNPKVIAVSSTQMPSYFDEIDSDLICGYLLKQEI